MKGKKHRITREQEAWLIENYADTKNEDLLAHIGWEANAGRSLRRIAVRLGLAKSKDFMRATQAKATAHARIANQGEGNAGARNLRIYGKAHQFKKGVTSRQRLGDERENERLRKMRISRNETIHKERIRINWGFEQQTKLRLISNPKQTMTRHALKKRGYIVPCRRATTVYYDSDTVRSEKVERRAAERGIIIKPKPNNYV